MIRVIMLLLFLATFLKGYPQEMVRITNDGQIVNIENSKVRKFLNEVTYDYDSPSLMSEYIGLSTKADESPCGVELDVSDVPENVSAIFVFAEGTDTKIRRELDKSEKVIRMTNLLPGKEYSYQVLDANTDVMLKSGRFCTEGRVRMIGFPSLYNCRDLGGWETLDGKRIKYGMLYRGVELHKGKHNTASQETLNAMRSLGIKAELDMRRIYPQAEYSDFIDNEIPAESAWGEDIPYLCVNMTGIESMLSSYPTKFRDALNFIINNLKENRPVYYHCVWGADRTGTLSALIEAILGVSLNDIYKEYELTSFSTYSSIRDKNSINIRLLNVIGYTPECGKTLQQCAIDYTTKTLGISGNDIKSLQNLLLESVSVPTEICNTVVTDERPMRYFSVSGVSQQKMQRGINIVVDAKGGVKKVIAQ